MASLSRFTVNSNELRNAIQAKNDLAESSRRLHFVMARKIQAWFRGIVTRNHLRKLRESATTIQRYWRGYRARMFVYRYLIERVHEMWQDHYDRMATRIQTVWRGYWTRKTQINFPQLRRWLKAVYATNDETLENMKRFRQREFEHMESEAERESMLWILFILFKLHHLLGTKCRPGVITNIDETRFTYIEEMLKCLKYDLYVSREKSVCVDCRIDRRSSLILHSIYFKKCEKEIREFEKRLQAGNAPIFTNQSFKRANGIVIKNESLDHQRKHRYSERCLRQNYVRMRPIELYEAINSMDCRLDHLRLKCPIHNIIF